MAEITLQNIHDCYAYGKRVAEGEIDIGTAAMNIARTGMDKGSAQIYLRCVRAMIRGERYTGTVKEIAVSHYLTAIMSDYGFDGLRKALESLRLHLEYQKKYQTLAGLKQIYDEFMDVLP
jgi:hypothetical protein